MFGATCPPAGSFNNRRNSKGHIILVNRRGIIPSYLLVPFSLPTNLHRTAHQWLLRRKRRPRWWSLGGLPHAPHVTRSSSVYYHLVCSLYHNQTNALRDICKPSPFYLHPRLAFISHTLKSDKKCPAQRPAASARRREEQCTMQVGCHKKTMKLWSYMNCLWVFVYMCDRDSVVHFYRHQ